MSKCLLTVLAFFIITSAFARTEKFIPGVIINNNGDSISGKINYTNLKKNIQVIDFINEHNEQHSYDASSVKGFYIMENREIYITSTVKVDQQPIDYDKVNQQPEDILKEIEVTIFLQELVHSSSLNLYSYHDGTRIHFYYTKGDNKPVELINHYVKSNGLIGTEEMYKQQLQGLASSCSNASLQLKNLHFVEKEIKALVLSIIKCSHPSETPTIKKETPLKVTFGIVAGVMYNAYAVNGSGKVYSDNFSTLALDNYSSNIGPVIGVGMTINLYKKSDRLHLVNELVFKNYKTSASGFTHTILNDYNNKVNISFSYLQLNTLLRYNFNTTGLKPFINIGIGNAIVVATNKNTNELTYENGIKKSYTAFSDPQKYETNLLAGAGLSSNKFHIECRYSTGNGFSSFIKLKTKVSSLQLLCTYDFR